MRLRVRSLWKKLQSPLGQLGAFAAGMIVRGEYGYMAAVKNNDLVKVPLEEVAGKLKTMDPKCPMIAEAKAIGICFGDK